MSDQSEWGARQMAATDTREQAQAADGEQAEARAERLAPAEAAIRTLMQASELAPVFGLAGTLQARLFHFKNENHVEEVREIPVC